MLILILSTGKVIHHKIIKSLLLATFTILNTVLIFLNLTDIFYFRFHLQRADADLFYVLRDPFSNSNLNVYLVLFAAIIALIIIGKFVYKGLQKMMVPDALTNRFPLITTLLIIFLITTFLTGTKKLLPTYPLTQLESVQLPLAQNSFFNFVFSIYRKKESLIPNINYMEMGQQQSLFSIYKKNTSDTAHPKNIVLFIMESVPEDFFDTSSAYKVTMPFLDSLVNKSTFYSNAFSYSYSSNKGITAILAGLPTITDIPLYHSNYTAIKRTSIGTALLKNNYSSAFFIGDNYDDFGFAKCCKWLGIQQYYCMQDIPGYEKMEKHTMGLHDEYVLKFMREKIGKLQPPFFATQYNISTHYPNDIPSNYINKYPNKRSSPQMISMQYYNDCLQQFFTESAKEGWYKNTVFIFCADHWAQPTSTMVKIDELKSFRIPIFIYDPSNEKKQVITAPVSQLDIVNTVLHFSALKDSFISYGTNLTDTILNQNRTVFTKVNSAVYQAVNDKYVLGFNAVEGKSLYCYAYKADPEKKNNLLHQPKTAAIESIILQIKAFLQTAANHYSNKPQHN